MGISNVTAGLEDKIAVFKGELQTVEARIKEIEEGIEVLHLLRNRATKLQSLIIGAEDIILDADPSWKRPIKPRIKRKWHSPFKSGEIGLRALSVLREKDRWMRPRDIAFIMLSQIGREGDRMAMDKTTNSVGGYLKRYEGDLVQSRGDFAKEWRVIRESGE